MVKKIIIVLALTFSCLTQASIWEELANIKTLIKAKELDLSKAQKEIEIFKSQKVSRKLITINAKVYELKELKKTNASHKLHLHLIKKAISELNELKTFYQEGKVAKAQEKIQTYQKIINLFSFFN